MSVVGLYEGPSISKYNSNDRKINNLYKTKLIDIATQEKNHLDLLQWSGIIEKFCTGLCLTIAGYCRCQESESDLQQANQNFLHTLSEVCSWADV